MVILAVFILPVFLYGWTLYRLRLRTLADGLRLAIVTSLLMGSSSALVVVLFLLKWEDLGSYPLLATPLSIALLLSAEKTRNALTPCPRDLAPEVWRWLWGPRFIIKLSMIFVVPLFNYFYVLPLSLYLWMHHRLQPRTLPSGLSQAMVFSVLIGSLLAVVAPSVVPDSRWLLAPYVLIASSFR